MSESEINQRVAGIEGELAASIPLDRNVSGPGFSWETVEFLVRVARDREIAMAHLARVAAAARRQLESSHLALYPHIHDALRLLGEIASPDALDRFAGDQRRILEEVRLSAYRAGRDAERAGAARLSRQVDTAIAQLKDLSERIAGISSALDR